MSYVKSSYVFISEILLSFKLQNIFCLIVSQSYFNHLVLRCNKTMNYLYQTEIVHVCLSDFR